MTYFGEPNLAREGQDGLGGKGPTRFGRSQVWVSKVRHLHAMSMVTRLLDTHPMGDVAART